MPGINLSDFFCGDEEIRFTHFRIPRQLITHPRFKHLSTDSKLLYGMLLDRMSLSAKNGWQDNTGRIYIYFTVKEVCEAIGCGRNKAIRLLAELDTRGAGLIERVRQGQGKPDRIFVKRITTREDTEAPSQDPDAPAPAADFSDVQRSENPTSSRRENRPLEVSKANPSYIDKNQTDFIHTNQSINPPAPSAKQREMDGYEPGEERKEKSMYDESSQQGFCTANACSAGFLGNASHGETHFPWTHRRNSYPALPRRTAPPKAVLSEQVCHLVAHQMTLVRGRSPLKTPICGNTSHRETHLYYPEKEDAMRKRNRHVSVWMNEQEYRHLKKQAELAGLGVDPFIRTLAAGVQLRPRPPETCAALLRELSAIGNNVNQIAYWANANKSVSDAEIAEAAALVRQAWRMVKETL